MTPQPQPPNHEGAYIKVITNHHAVMEDDIHTTSASTKANPVITHYVPNEELDAVTDTAELLNFDIEVIEEHDLEVLVKVTKETPAFD